MPTRFRPSSSWSLHGSFPLLGGLLLLVVLLGMISGREAPPDEVQDRLRIRLEAARSGSTNALTVGGEELRVTEGVRRYYRTVAFEPAWTGADGPTAQAETLRAVLSRADGHGLRPADYHVAMIDSLRNVLRAAVAAGRPMDSRTLADFELLCTDAFLLYGAHLLGGRVDPVDVVPTWNLDRRQQDLVQQLQNALDSGSVKTTLAGLAPPQSEYRALRQALAEYRRLQSDGGWPRIPDGPAMEEGATGERVRLLRRRLLLTGDLSEVVTTDASAFDARLRRAVARFQERHGLAIDGVVGSATRSAMNVPVEERIEQIRVNLERWRWLPRDLGDPHIIVNIADFWLRVVDQDRTVLQMRVVVGLPYRQTPVFSDEITYLVFNPYWYVPRSIAVKDKLPDFRRNPALVSQLGFEVFEGWGADARKVDPATLNWDRLSASNFPYRFRQRPGPLNALGQVKFMFPNSYDVYLHDTPSRELFNHTQRSFSSGCIRVEYPVDLATFLLRSNEGWTEERVESAMKASRERAVVLNRKVPVHLLYWTAWMEGSEAIHFRRDVYDRDDAVLSALNEAPSPLSNRTATEQSDD